MVTLEANLRDIRTIDTLRRARPKGEKLCPRAEKPGLDGRVRHPTDDMAYPSLRSFIAFSPIVILGLKRRPTAIKDGISTGRPGERKSISIRYLALICSLVPALRHRCALLSGVEANRQTLLADTRRSPYCLAAALAVIQH